MVSIYSAGGSSVPLISERKGTDPPLEAPALHTLRLIARQPAVTSIASLACVRLTGWPVALNWRRAVLSADASLLVNSFQTTRIAEAADHFDEIMD